MQVQQTELRIIAVIGYTETMKPPVFVRPLTTAELTALRAGLRSPAAFTVRRCQVLLASARHEPPPAIATALGCSSQAVRNIIAAFETRGLAALLPRSTRPHSTTPLLDEAALERLREVLHKSPRLFNKDRSTWTLHLIADVCFEQGIAPRPISIELVRLALKRLGVRWQRAKHWITSPDPAYAKKKRAATA